MYNSNINNKNNFFPILIFGILFFIFGLVSWVNAMLIPYFKVCCELTHTQSYFVALAFYIAYLVMSIPAAKLIGRIGYKKSVTVGLWLMAFGTVLFVPAAYMRTYGVFLTGLFVIGTGLAVLQTVANPYVTVLGTIETAAKRISIMGLCNKIAGILAPLVFAAVILESSDTQLFEQLNNNQIFGQEKEQVLDELIKRVITPYTLLSAFLFLFGIVICFIRLPEIVNSGDNGTELEEGHSSIMSYPYLILGVLAIFFHVAAQVISIDTIISYAESMGYTLQEAKIFPSITLSCALIGYFLGILLIPRYATQLTMFRFATIGGLILSLLVLFVPGEIMFNGHMASFSIFCLSLMGVCNALIYAGIWPLAIHDLGQWTSMGSSLMVMALCGNAFMPVIYGLIADNYNLRTGYIVLIPCFLYLIFYAFYGYKLNYWSELWKIRKTKKIKIHNGKIITPEKIIDNGCIILSDGKIVGIEQGNHEIDACVEYDAKGNYIAPGFIDIHTHGAGGSDFMDCTVEDCLTIAKTHMKHGTTLLYPTTLASDNKELFDFLDVYDKVKNQQEGASFGGLHLEGPYFAYAFRGAQDPKYLRDPLPVEYMKILERSKDIVRWSIAPELPGALSFGDVLTERSILPSIAHTDAVYEDIVEAVKHGFTHITHFYSCMNGITRRNAFRYAGCIEAGYLLDEITIELITDGIHVTAPLMKLALKNKGSDKIALITDSMRAAGTSDNKSILGSRKKGQEVLVEDGVAKMPDKQSFAGSIATADRLVRNMYQMGGATVEEAVKMMSDVPAKIMGCDHYKGKLKKNYDADIVVFDSNITVKNVFINGILKI